MFLVRHRYAVFFLAAAVGMAWGRFENQPGLTDWLYFEYAARVVLGWHKYAALGGPPLHLYARNPWLQIGPPAVFSVMAFQWLPPHVGQFVIDVVMTLLGLGAVISLDRWLPRAGDLARTARFEIASLVLGAPVLLSWGYLAGLWHHVDDMLAVGLAVIAAALIARKRPWWLVGLLLGTAMAAKPWAIVLVPILLGLDRRDRARTALVVLATAAAWWGPFVLADPATTQALGGFQILPKGGSTLYLLGIHGGVQQWLRPVQFVIGTLAAIWAARRRGWWSAGLAGLAVRVLTDPYAWLYYGLGPIMFALLWDLGDLTIRQRGDAGAGGRFRRFPLMTACTLLLEFALPIALGWQWGASAPVLWIWAVGKLIWGVAVLVLIARSRPVREIPFSRLPQASDVDVESDVVTA